MQKIRPLCLKCLVFVDTESERCWLNSKVILKAVVSAPFKLISNILSTTFTFLRGTFLLFWLYYLLKICKISQPRTLFCYFNTHFKATLSLVYIVVRTSHITQIHFRNSLTFLELQILAFLAKSLLKRALPHICPLNMKLERGDGYLSTKPGNRGTQLAWLSSKIKKQPYWSLDATVTPESHCSWQRNNLPHKSP